MRNSVIFALAAVGVVWAGAAMAGPGLGIGRGPPFTPPGWDDGPPGRHGPPPSYGAPGPVAGVGLPIVLAAGAYALYRRRRAKSPNKADPAA